MNWLLYPSVLSPAGDIISKFKNSYSRNGYTLLHNFPATGFVTDKEGAFFCDGFYLPQSGIPELNGTKLYGSIRQKGNSALKGYKGNFCFLLFTNEKIQLWTDPFGIQKYFFLHSDSGTLASDDFFAVKAFSKSEICLPNLYEYLVFNYFIENRTLYNDIFQSEGGSSFQIYPVVRQEKYFDLVEFLNTREPVHTGKKHLLLQVKELWTTILKQYQGHFAENTASLTLTAGFDSRMILAGLLANHSETTTFTFGNKESRDVKLAQYISSQMGLQHRHYYPNDDFFRHFSGYAEQSIRGSSGQSSVSRAHRLDAFTRHSQVSKLVYFGFGGSEILRALYPDQLMVSKYVLEKWKNNPDEKGFLEQFLSNNFCVPDKQSFDLFYARLQENAWIQNPDEYLFRVIVPNHFGQDIRWIAKNGAAGISPYWDMDFLNFMKNTVFFLSNDRKKVFTSTNNFLRLHDPYFSSKIIHLTNPRLASFDIGKGYSPADFSSSIVWSSLKFLKHKILETKKEKPNFQYDNWYKNYLITILKTQKDLIPQLDAGRALENIEKLSTKDQLGYLPYTKFANLSLIHRLK